jgi:hypothetical protein
VWVAALWIAGTRTHLDVRPAQAPGAGAARRELGVLPRRGRRTAVRSLARVDRRTLLGDRLLLLIAAGVPLLALAVRWVGGPGLAWVEGRYGVDLAGYLPLAWAFVLVLHTPAMFGALTGLLFCEDRDAGLLPAVALTRASLRTLLVYRLGATMAVTALAVVAGLGIAGAEHAAGPSGILATAVVAGAAAVVPALLLATLARDRVQAMALTKVMGIPLYLPLAWWFVDGPAGWVFAVVPTGWAAQALWAGSATQAWAFAAGGLAVTAVLAAALLSRFHRSLVRGGS